MLLGKLNDLHSPTLVHDFEENSTSLLFKKENLTFYGELIEKTIFLITKLLTSIFKIPIIHNYEYFGDEKFFESFCVRCEITFKEFLIKF